jgi:hypothetical protein
MGAVGCLQRGGEPSAPGSIREASDRVGLRNWLRLGLDGATRGRGRRRGQLDRAIGDVSTTSARTRDRLRDPARQRGVVALPGRLLRSGDQRVWCGDLGRPLSLDSGGTSPAAPGRTIFLGNSPLQIVCLSSDGEETTPRLQRPYFGLRRLDWRGIEIDPGGVEFNLPLSSWVRLFRETGFAIEDYREWPAPAHAGGKPFNVSSAWATDFPAEQAWILCKAG